MAIASFSWVWDPDEVVRGLYALGQSTQPQVVETPIVNQVFVAVADAAATTPQTAVGAEDTASISDFGTSSVQLFTILADIPFALELAEYLIRPLPEYWFSSLEVLLNGIPAGDRDAVAELEIGDAITVSKRFPNVTNPVVQDLFVEGIEHDITVDRHVIRIYCSPANLYDEFELDLSELTDPAYGLG